MYPSIAQRTHYLNDIHPSLLSANMNVTANGDSYLYCPSFPGHKTGINHEEHVCYAAE